MHKDQAEKLLGDLDQDETLELAIIIVNDYLTDTQKIQLCEDALSDEFAAKYEEGYEAGESAAETEAADLEAQDADSVGTEANAEPGQPQEPGGPRAPATPGRQPAPTDAPRPQEEEPLDKPAPKAPEKPVKEKA